MSDTIRKKNSTKMTPVSPRGEREKLVRVLLVIVCVVLAIAALFFALFGLRKVLFTGNPRLELRSVAVETTGYWENKEKILARRLNLTSGENLFTINIRKVRQELQKIPNVESCEVVRVLPDQIKLKIVERIPRAVLKNPRSPWVVDENGMVIPRHESLCMLQKDFLPVLHTDMKNIMPGQPIPTPSTSEMLRFTASRSLVANAAMLWDTPSAPFSDSVGTLSEMIISPLSFTIPPLMKVPPRSIPM